MSAGFAGESRKGPRDALRALFAEAKRRARRRRRRLLIPALGLLAAGAVVLVLVGGSGGGGGAGGASATVRAQIAARLRLAAARQQLNPLGSTPTLHQLLGNFAVLRRPQSAADRSWHPQCACAGAASQLNRLTRFAVKLPHGYRVFLDVERFITGGQLNTPAGSYMLNLDFVDRYGTTNSEGFGANTQYNVEPLSTERPGPARDRPAGGAAFASLVPDGVAKVSWTFACPRGRGTAGARTLAHSRTVEVPVVNNVAATWLAKSPGNCAGAMKVVWFGADGRVVTTFGNDGNLVAPPFVKGGIGHGTHRVLTSTGIGSMQFGSSSSGAVRALTRQFGAPADEDIRVQGCASDRETVWTSPGLADPLTVYTRDGRFIGYQYGSGAAGLSGLGPGAVLATRAGLTLGQDVRAARALYPVGFATQASTYVGYWSAANAGSRFYGAATPDRYPAHSVDPGDRVSTIGAGSFPACTATQSSRPQLVRLPKPGAHASASAQALYYLRAAMLNTRQSGSCSVSNTAVARTSPGAPSQALLAALDVLRKPRTAADNLPRSLRGNAPRGRFVNFIRLATTARGVAYYIVPSSSSRFGPMITQACITAMANALHAEQHRIPASVRARTLVLATRQFARERLMLARQTGDAVCLVFAGHDMSGGSCSATADDIRRWGMTNMMGSIAGIVPDGVVAVSVHVPAADGQRAVTAHAKVVNNVFTTSIAESFGGRRKPTITWFSASGHVIRSVPGEVDGVGGSGWCGGC